MLSQLPPYRPPRWLRSGHLQTVYPALFRSVEGVSYRRERLDLPDGDVLDLDWSEPAGRPGDRLVIISHGLEGSSERAYVRGMVRAFTQGGWDALAWNLRGCGGTPNRLFQTYHSGATGDLDAVIEHALARGYPTVALVGFSLGGNLTLKYLGERGKDAPARVVGAAAFSVPCDLASSAEQLARPENAMYMRRFMLSLNAKLADKQARFPDQLPGLDVSTLKTFVDFDGAYTAPAHGFSSAEDYWRRASSRPFLPAIRRPTLLVNAQDDPFLAPPCFPIDEARANPDLHLLMPRWGGHVGFMAARREDPYWSERVATAFLTRLADGRIRQAA
ncbi:MAG: alpha/beta fold hydrolase [Rubricoccaceae bacterium]|nr:alpha/beta fold hydrolase [Rubricoccaceae bacterium]